MKLLGDSLSRSSLLGRKDMFSPGEFEKRCFNKLGNVWEPLGDSGSLNKHATLGVLSTKPANA